RWRSRWSAAYSGPCRPSAPPAAASTAKVLAMPCPALPRVLRTGVGSLLLGSLLLLAACGRNPDRGSARALPQPTPDRTVDAVVRGLVTVTPPEDATPAPARVAAVAVATTSSSAEAAPDGPAPTPARQKP